MFRAKYFGRSKSPPWPGVLPNGSSGAIPLLGEGGVAARSIRFREASLVRADGVVRSNHRIIGSWTNHPVRSSKGGFAAFLLMSRPPLLNQGGDWPRSNVRQQARPRRGLPLSKTLAPISKNLRHPSAVLRSEPDDEDQSIVVRAGVVFQQMLGNADRRPAQNVEFSFESGSSFDAIAEDDEN